jgi:hypothetical protein
LQKPILLLDTPGCSWMLLLDSKHPVITIHPLHA